MFLRLSPRRAPELLEARDFTAFKVVRASGVDDSDVEALGRRDGADVFVDRDVLLAAGPSGDEDWIAGLDAMIESVRRFGWVDDRGAVRAHVETA